MLFFHFFFFLANLSFLLSKASSAFGSCVSLPAAEHRDGARARPWGAGQEWNPRDNWSGHGRPTNQQPSLFYPLHPKQTFALQLSSDASQKRTPTLLSGNANHSLHSTALLRKRRKRVGKGDTGNERDAEGIKRRGQGQIPESHKAKPESLVKTNKKTGFFAHWYAQAGTIGLL